MGNRPSRSAAAAPGPGGEAAGRPQRTKQRRRRKRAQRRRRGWWPWSGPRQKQQRQVQERRPSAGPDAESGERCLEAAPRLAPALSPLSPAQRARRRRRRRRRRRSSMELENLLANTMLLRARQGGCTAAPRPRPGPEPVQPQPCREHLPCRGPRIFRGIGTPGPAQPRCLECGSANGQPGHLTPKLLRRLSAPPQDPREGSPRAASVRLLLIPCPALLPEPRDAVWHQHRASTVTCPQERRPDQPVKPVAKNRAFVVFKGPPKRIL